MDPWAIPYICHAILAIIMIYGTLNYRNTSQFIKMIDDQIQINRALHKRLRELEQRDD